MSLPSEILPVGLLGAGAGAAAGYEIPRSARFNSADSAYLSKTFASAGNQKTWTWSAWVKRSRLGVDQAIWVSVPNSSVYGYFYFLANDTLRFQIRDLANSPTYNSINLTSAVYRDTSAWYHIVVHLDTTQATATNRAKLYVNGVEQAFGQDQRSSIPQNRDAAFNAAQPHAISSGLPYLNSLYFNGYLADIHFIDGQALDPTSFGEFDDNNVWQPKAFSGDSYGTNGFHLDFADNSSAAALGYDAAGSNDWTVNNLSVTAGAGNDSLRDSPTNGTQTDTGAGGEVVGNYCTLNPLWNNGHILSNGNLDYAPPSPAAWTSVLSTFGMPSGKWYWEQTYISGSANCMAGFGNVSSNLNSYPNDSNSTGYDFVDGNIYGAGAGGPAGATLSAGDIMGVSVDVDAGEAKFYKNGVLQKTVTHGITGTLFPLVSSYDGVGCVNFGQRPFAYTAPEGFKALCTANLPTPTIEDGSTAMDVVTYTGNGSTQVISGLAFSPDLVWIKSRSLAYNHRLIDTVRGAQKFLYSNTNDAEVTSTLNDRFTSFDATGFTLGAADSPSADGLNQNAATYVGWCWDGGSSTVSNSDGTITSSVRANASAGISVVSYTGNGTSGATVGHGLNVAPSFYVCKFRNTNAANGPWYIYHKSLGATKTLTLNTTDAVSTLSSVWNNTEPSSTVFSLGNAGDTNGSGRNFIAYCFAPVSGFSSFGSYTGNGSADGPFVYTGHRSRWVMIKRTDVAGDWIIWDALRPGYNASQLNLYPNLSNAENAAGYNIDIVSNGFKLRTAGGTSFNSSGGTYVWAAFAENPFSLARAR